MENSILVSVITPSYNSADFIAETIEAIQAQTYTHWELLITDDCSTDDTCKIISKYCEKDNRIKLFHLAPNGGAGKARNNSIKEAKGRFIAFCDSDDKWYPEKLERQIKFMIDNNYELTYTSYDVIDEIGTPIGKVKCLNKLSYRTLLRDNGIGCLTAMYDTRRIGKIYMPLIRKRQDWCLWLDIIKKTGYAYGLQERLSIYRERKNSISANKIEMLHHNFRVYHEVEGYGKVASFILLMAYFMPYYIYKKIKNKLN